MELSSEKLKDLLTADHIRSYAQACIKVCEVLLELKKENFKSIVIPSRGAYPFFYRASKAFYNIANTGADLMDYESSQHEYLLPFTSDWSDADLNIDSAAMGTFWVKILADVLNNESSRYGKG